MIPTKPTRAYWEFVRDQARRLARTYQKVGLLERARHHRLQEDWATEQLAKLGLVHARS